MGWWDAGAGEGREYESLGVMVPYAHQPDACLAVVAVSQQVAEAAGKDTTR